MFTPDPYGYADLFEWCRSISRDSERVRRQSATACAEAVEKRLVREHQAALRHQAREGRLMPRR